MKTIDNEQALKLLKEAEKLPREELLKLQKERLKELVSHVRVNSPYFKELYKDVPKDFKLTDLPPTRKEDLIPRYEDWVTDREIRYKDVLKYLEESDGRPGFLGKYSALHTSGTTGDPLIMLRDPYHNVIHGAMVKRRLLTEDMSEYMDITRHRRAAVIFVDKAASAYNSYLRTVAAHPEYKDNFIVLNTMESTDTILGKIDDFKPEQISGYPSSLALLARAQIDGRIDIAPKMVASSAEVMNGEVFGLIKEAFGCKIVNNYCSTEGGEAAMASDCKNLHVNEDWVIIEPVDKDGNIMTGSDEWSEGIYITDLTNYVQPIIRYYMSDRVKLHTEDDGSGKPFIWMEIMGRVGGVINFCQKPILQINLDMISENLALAVQFIHNKENEMEIRAIPTSGYEKAEALRLLGQRFEDIVKKEGCKDYKIVLSDDDLIKNERGGKLSSYIKKY